LDRSQRLQRDDAGRRHETPRTAPQDPVAPRPLWRFAALFAVSALVLFGLLLAPWLEPAEQAFTNGLVSLSAALVRSGGGSALAQYDVMRSQSTDFAVRMANGCNGLHVMIVLWSAIVAFPASLSQKIRGLVIGSVAIHGINLLRFISLFFLGQYAPNWFEFAHVYFWESMIMLDSLVIFWLWTQYVSRSSVTLNAGE
jgi:exosortase H (IPTLxxWG-CTERM-specific)